MHPFVVADDAPRRRTTRPPSSRRTTSSRCSARSSASPRPAGVPFDAFVPLVRGHGRQRRGPGSRPRRSPDRSRAATSRRLPPHLDALPDGERDTYRAWRAAALALTGATTPSFARAAPRDVLGVITVTRVARAPRRRATTRGPVGRRVGLVPTMGYFHAGHRSLMRGARADNDLVVVSLFVNPLQFGPTEDLDALPARPRGRPRRPPRPRASTCLFAPSVDEMYPQPAAHHGARRRASPPGCAGAARPDALRRRHDGRDQAVLDRRSVPRVLRPQGRPAARGGPPDGRRPATSRSRSSAARSCASPTGSRCRAATRTSSPTSGAPRAVLLAALQAAADAVVAGERDADTRAPRSSPDVSATEPLRRSSSTPRCVDAARARAGRPTLDGDVLVAVAAQVGRARLIDNVTVSIGPEASTSTSASSRQRVARHREEAADAPHR